MKATITKILDNDSNVQHEIIDFKAFREVMDAV